MASNPLEELLAVVNDLTNRLRKLKESAEVVLKEPIAEIDTNTPQGRFLGALLGLGTGGIAPPTKLFEDGVAFKAYPISPYIPDYDAIGGLNQSDVTGEKWRPYNNGKAAWNAMEMGSGTLDQSEAARLQRIREYAGPLRHDLDGWPATYRIAYESTHGG